MYALLTRTEDLRKSVAFQNNGRTDGVYIYVNGKIVTANHMNGLSEERQKQELTFFLQSYNYSLVSEK